MNDQRALGSRQRTSRMKLPFVEIWLVLVLFVAYASVPLGIDSAVIWFCLLLQYGLLVASVWRPVRIYRNLPTFVSAEFLFLFFSYMIFFYPYQLHMFGIYDLARSQYFSSNTFLDQSNHAVLLCSIGVVSFRAGLRSLRLPGSVSDRSPKLASRLDYVTVQSLSLPVFALLALLIVFYQASGWKAAGEGRYTGTTVGGPVAEGTYLGITVLAMVATALWIFPMPKDAPARSMFLRLSVLLSAIWAIRLLLAGDRNSFTLIAIVAIGGLFTFRLRVGRWALAALCAIGLTLYSAVEQLRSGQIGSLLDFFTIGPGATTGSANGETSFNISTISVRAALASVPERFDYGYGLYQLVGFGGVIPFIRGALIPPDMIYTQSSDVLGEILLGSSATWGVGSNIIVDVYMDFGLLSVPVLLFMLGLGVAYSQRGVMQFPGSVWRAVLYLVTLALVAEIPRYTLAFPVRPLVWVLMLFWVVSLISPAVSSRVRKSQHRDRVVEQT